MEPNKQKTLAKRTAGSRALLLLAEAEDEYGISRWTFRRAIYAKDLRAIRLTDSCNAPIRLRRDDIDAWLARGAGRGKPLSPAATAAVRRDCAEAEAKAAEREASVS